MPTDWMVRWAPWAAPWLAQWQASARLRWGLRLVLGILLVNGMLTVLDAVDHKRDALKAARLEGMRLTAMAQEGDWAARARQSQEQLVVFRSMAWSEADAGLGEAALQDWLRKLTSGLGLTVRDLQVTRAALGAGAAGATAAPGESGASPTPPQSTAIRARLVVELKRSAVLAMLAELQRSEQSVVVERLVWRSTSVPPQVELDLRALAGHRASASEPKGQP